MNIVVFVIGNNKNNSFSPMLFDFVFLGSLGLFSSISRNHISHFSKSEININLYHEQISPFSLLAPSTQFTLIVWCQSIENIETGLHCIEEHPLTVTIHFNSKKHQLKQQDNTTPKHSPINSLSLP